ncbi:MAG: hypothetical protein OZ928_12850 [Polyangiaceae bacterium]|nr:hypothetical protein [Polyangiaceae bacterium]
MTGSRLAMGALLSVWGLLALPGCGSEDAAGGSGGTAGTGGGATGGAAGVGTGGGSAIECDEPASLALSGLWAAKARLTVSLTAQPGGTVTLCPAEQRQEATLFLYLEVHQDPSDPSKLDAVTPHVCSVELPTVEGGVGSCSNTTVKMELPVPKALLDAMPKIALAPVTASLSGAAPGATLSTEKVLFVAGSSKPAPELPTWNASSGSCGSTTVGRTNQCEVACVSDCSTLRDDDGDGFPGITLHVCGRTQQDITDNVPCNNDDPSEAGTTIQGRAWLDLQIDPSLEGTVKSSCEMAGTVDASILYNVVGADVTVSNGVISVSEAIRSLPTFHVEKSESPYRMLRVDGQYGAPDWSLGADPSAACAAVLQHQNDF